MLNLRELNALNREQFTKVIGPAFEHSSWVAEETWPQRPFESREQLHGALCRTVSAADQRAKLELIRAHPDLAGRAVLTKASGSEQQGAGLDRLSEDEIALFDAFNRQYRDKFGFPFVICARLNKKEAILDAFPVRLQNSPEQEKETALGEIFKIADLRLRAIVQ
jgi:2-oxo-4-hydroxy-4-carboxy-5-ureidoimidazoline decarboxylase